MRNAMLWKSRIRPLPPLACLILLVIAPHSDRSACGQAPLPKVDLWMIAGGAVGETARFNVQQTVAPSLPFAVMWSLAPPWYPSPPFYPAAAGQLNASGRASFFFGVPNVPALEGVVINLVAAVWWKPYVLQSYAYHWPIARRSTPVARPVGKLPSSSLRPTVAALTDGRFLITGGKNSSSTTLSSQVLTYDPNLNQLRTIGAMTTGRIGHVTTQLSSGDVLIVGAYHPATTAELYDLRANRSTPIGSRMSFQLGPDEGVHLVDPVSRREWVFHSTLSGSGLVYDGQRRRFSSVIVGGARAAYALAALAGKPEVVLAGGGTRQSISDRVEVYNAATGVLRVAGRMTRPRIYAAALALDGRHVLIIGGADAKGKELDDVELFDTFTGASLVLPVRLRVPRYGHVVGLDRAGHVRVCGGRGPSPGSRVDTLIEELSLTGAVPFRPVPGFIAYELQYTFGAGRGVLAVAHGDVFYVP